jgi:hypothetical protein
MEITFSDSQKGDVGIEPSESESEPAMKISMEIVTTVEFEVSSDKYPAGMDPDTALALEVENASRDPHEYVAMQGAVTSVVGQLVQDNGRPLRMRDRLRWGAGAASSH